MSLQSIEGKLVDFTSHENGHFTSKTGVTLHSVPIAVLTLQISNTEKTPFLTPYGHQN